MRSTCEQSTKRDGWSERRPRAATDERVRPVGRAMLAGWLAGGRSSARGCLDSIREGAHAPPTHPPQQSGAAPHWRLRPGPVPQHARLPREAPIWNSVTSFETFILKVCLECRFCTQLLKANRDFKCNFHLQTQIPANKPSPKPSPPLTWCVHEPETSKVIKVKRDDVLVQEVKGQRTAGSHMSSERPRRGLISSSCSDAIGPKRRPGAVTAACKITPWKHDALIRTHRETETHMQTHTKKDDFYFDGSTVRMDGKDFFKVATSLTVFVTHEKWHGGQWNYRIFFFFKGGNKSARWAFLFW